MLLRPRRPSGFHVRLGRRRCLLALAATIGLLALVGFGASMLFTGESPEDAPATPESTNARTTTGARGTSTGTPSAGDRARHDRGGAGRDDGTPAGNGARDDHGSSGHRDDAADHRAGDDRTR